MTPEEKFFRAAQALHAALMQEREAASMNWARYDHSTIREHCLLAQKRRAQAEQDFMVAGHVLPLHVEPSRGCGCCMRCNDVVEGRCRHQDTKEAAAIELEQLYRGHKDAAAKEDPVLKGDQEPEGAVLDAGRALPLRAEPYPVPLHAEPPPGCSWSEARARGDAYQDEKDRLNTEKAK